MQVNKLILVTGGARSGKSAYAEQLAKGFGGSGTYIATAQAGDGEMQERIRRHRERRSAFWLTREAPLDAADQLREAGSISPVVLVDCLTLYVTNHLLQEFSAGQRPEDHRQHCMNKVLAAVEELITAAIAVPAWVIIVSNEVGSGIVPDNALSRLFRDIAGIANQRAAAAADEAYLLVSGLPLRIK